MTSAPAALLLVLFLTSCAERTPQPPAPIVLLPPESVFTPLRTTKDAGLYLGGYRQPCAGTANSFINLRRSGDHSGPVESFFEIGNNACTR